MIIAGKSDVGFFEATATFTEDRFGAVDQNVADGGVTEQLFERSESEGFIHHLADEQIPPAKRQAIVEDLLGGKGANLAEMTSVLKLPVPPGFTISTDACRAYMHGGWPKGLDEEIATHVFRLEKAMGRKLGDPFDPLLVSVRSGAKFSMPGMMDTVLNLGLNDESVKGLATVTGDERFAYDSYRRFISMYGRIVLGIDGAVFEHPLEEAKHKAGASSDADLSAAVLKKLCTQYQAAVKKATGKPFPQKPREQLRGAIEAVFRSWNGARAVAYRVREKISHDLGTAVNVQTMVFGNRDNNSGTGVGFTRNAATGENKPYGDFLINAQGEDVVAGIRNTEDLDTLGKHFPKIHDELLEALRRISDAESIAATCPTLDGERR